MKQYNTFLSSSFTIEIEQLRINQEFLSDDDGDDDGDDDDAI